MIDSFRRIVSRADGAFDRSYFIDRSRLEAAVEEHAPGYAAASPFPHAVIDGLFPDDVLDRVAEEFPAPDSEIWRKFEHAHSKKLALMDEERMPPTTRQLLYQLNGGAFVSYLEQLTGIDGLVSDPHFEGGGIHQIPRGGRLEVHADFNWHARLRLDRRLNVLVYLNRGWRDEYGGNLELWTRDMSRCEVRIAPVFNRCVVFSTTDFSYHGHPHPLACPEGMSRKSIALYYYTNGRPADERSEAHSTLYQQRPAAQT
jgi:Rps23 Pro-64 3,4-dihydroxylase Tpa1-like proline 4-hydroxylase